MRAAVVAGCDAPPVLDPSEQVLDLVALTIEHLIVILRDLAAAAGWNARLDASCFKFLSKPGTVVARSAIRYAACGKASSTRRAPLWSLIWPSGSSMMIGCPSPSQTVCSLEFSPPLVRPIRRGLVPPPGAPLPTAAGSRVAQTPVRTVHRHQEGRRSGSPVWFLPRAPAREKRVPASEETITSRCRLMPARPSVSSAVEVAGEPKASAPAVIAAG